jgi:hypothetical protein
MLISGRQAVRILLARGQMTGEAQSRSLLRAGAAGPAVITDTGLFFERHQVQALADREWLDTDAQDEACPLGVYIARLSRSSTVDLTRPWADIAEQLGPVPTMPMMTTALLEVTIRAASRLPWVAILHGYVVCGADLTGLRSTDEGMRFLLEPPGDWFDTWRERRLPGRRGGRPWEIRRGRVP